MSNFFKYLAFLNVFLIIFIIIYEHNDLKKILLWGILVGIFSLFGFISYIIFGNGLKFNAKQKVMIKQKTAKSYISRTNWYKNYVQENSKICPLAKKFKSQYNFGIWHNNDIKIFLNGKDFVDDLISAIKLAKTSINLEFYIFSDDETGKLIFGELIKKAKQGIKINIIYDALGSKKTSKRFWQKLKNDGINVCSFFPNALNIPYVNFKINHRNHRKIAIIDGKIAYTGGINLRNDHLGIKTHLKPWRDTQVKIVGNAVYALQEIFLNDFAFANNCEYTDEDINLYFPIISAQGRLQCQIIESGPEKDVPYIYSIYSTIISSCKKFLYIQTPYFIINKDMVKLLLDAKKRNIDIKIMIPNIPDKKIVYGASLISLKKLINANISIYLYNGFIHSKTLCTESVVSIGTCNFDNRSFFLNFEDTCLFYNKPLIGKNKGIFENDIKDSLILTKKKYNKLKIRNLFLIFIYKIISQLL